MTLSATVGNGNAWIPSDTVLLRILDGRISSLDYYKEICARAAMAFGIFKSLRLSDLMLAVGGSQLRLARLINYWLESGLVHAGQGRDAAGYAGWPCPRDAAGNWLMPDSELVANRLEAIVAAAQATHGDVREEYDQYRVTSRSVVRRIMFAMARLDLVDASVAFLGDDDMAGVALAALGVAAQVTCLDIDADLVAGIARFAADHEFVLRSMIYDATREVPSSLRGKFTVVMTDPSPQPGGTELFIRRAAELLSDCGVLYISLWPTHSAIRIGDQVALSRHGFCITDCIPAFSLYGLDRVVRSDEDRALLDRLAPDMSVAFAETWIRAELRRPQGCQVNG